MSKPAEPPVDYASLAELLKALSYATRLELLDALRFPRTLAEIKVSPSRTEEGDNPDRPMARQTIQAHLDKLVAADLVRDEPVQPGDRATRRYVVNAQRLYVVTEELRRLATWHAGRGAQTDTTDALTMPGEDATPRARGPRLVLVHGVYEGKAFLLDPKYASDGGWTIGRKRGLAVSLDYDPFVSQENARISLDAKGAFVIADIPGSRNGTSVNWDRLDKPRALESGDVVGVGRSLMVFVAK